ncbi:MAG: hypothetical protein WC413_00475 [Candidatus Nanoarchaeia archaeon]
MNKDYYREKILKGMCECAQTIDVFYYMKGANGISFIGNKCPKPFKPSAGDKLIFNKILDKVLDNILLELEKDNIKHNNWDKKYNPKSNIDADEQIEYIWGDTNPTIIGVNVMAKFYYPEYGEYIDMPERKELRDIYNNLSKNTFFAIP